ncbi:MAG: hypothetical protein VXY99_02310, partial [Pseudomonadota bacterium]|nr:hypothetical protein [Pseudomonadota bacterium]
PVTLSRRDKLSLFDIDNWLWDEEYGDPSPEYNYGSDYELLTIRTKQSHQKESCISLYTPSMDALYASDDYFDVEFAEELTSAIRNTYNLIKEVTQNYPSLNMTPGASLAELNDLSKGEVCRLCYLSKLRTETLPISIDYDQDPTVFGDRFVSLLRDAKVTQVVANTWLQPSSGYAMVYACNAFDSDGKSHYRFELFCGFRHAMGKGHPVFETLKKAGITFSIQHEYEYSASASYVEFEINDDYTSYYAFKSPDNNHVPCQVMFAVYHADTTTRIPPFHASDITPDNDFLRELISFPPYRNGHVLSSIMANVNMESWGGIAKELVKKHNSKDGVNLPVFHRELSMRLDP